MSQRRIAWTVWGVTVGLLLSWVPVDAALPNEELDIGWYAFASAAVLLYATVGALITSRQMGNRVGLLFSWVAFTAAVGGTSGAYASLAVARDLPLLAAATWVAQVALAAMIGPLAFLFLIFPTGRPASPRWAWLMRAMLAAYAITIVLFAVTPGPMRSGFAELHNDVDNPIGLPASWEGPIEAMTTVFGSIVFGGAIVSILSLIQRYRRASATERQQIRWLAWLGGFTGAYILVMFALETSGVLPEDGALSNASFIVLVLLIFIGIPVTCAIAILKHNLWDLDVVVKKTIQYGVLLVGFTALAGLLLVAVPTMVIGVGTNGGGMGLVPFLMGIAIAVGFSLARSRARRWANRIVYGRRSTPYEVLSDFAERVGETYSTEDVLPRMAQLLGGATGARSTRVWLRVGGVMRADAAWPSDVPAPPDIPSPDDDLPGFGAEQAFAVRHQGELLGALTLTEAPDDPMNPAKTKLVLDMAAQAGLVLRNVRLIEDLRESRRRIVSAQDERARALERNIHDGAQQQLVALAVQLRLAESMVDRDPAKARDLLAQLQSRAAETLEDLRDLARGIYPPLLADKGLPAALEAQARKSPVPVTVQPDGIGRYKPDVEAAVYFSCLEALNNVAKYAEASAVEIRLADTNGELRFEVIDDGRGFDLGSRSYGTGLQGIADRLEAIGGGMEVRSAPGNGTTLVGSIRLVQGAPA